MYNITLVQLHVTQSQCVYYNIMSDDNYMVEQL